MHVLVTGAFGYLGGMLVPELRERFPEATLSLLEGASVKRTSPLRVISRHELLAEGDTFTHIIHLAARSSDAVCQNDPEGALDSNVTLTEELATRAASDNAHFIFISSDFVFDGLPTAPTEGFKETDMPHPKGAYALTKRAAEERVLSLLPDTSTVVRLALVYGPPRVGTRNSFLQWIVDALKQKREVKLFSDEWRTPVYAADVVNLLCLLTQSSPLGILHCGGPERLSRSEIGRIVCSALKLEDISFITCTREEAGLGHRPKDLSLCSEKMYQLFDLEPVSFTARLAEMLK